MTTPELKAFYRHIRPKLAATTFQRKQAMLRACIKHLAINNKSLTSATKTDLEHYLLSLKTSHQYKQAICSLLRELYDFLQKRYPEQYPHVNPARDIRFKPTTRRCLPCVPGKAAIDALIAALPRDDRELSLRNRLLAEMAYGSGLRRDEMRRADIEDVDFEEKTIRVNGKGSKERIVPLTQTSIVLIRGYCQVRNKSRGPLFTSTTTRRRASLQTIYNDLKYGVGIRPHLLRHACATHMLQNGCDTRIIQTLLGHTKLTSTQIYTHLDHADLRRIISTTHPRAEKILQ